MTPTYLYFPPENSFELPNFAIKNLKGRELGRSIYQPIDQLPITNHLPTQAPILPPTQNQPTHPPTQPTNQHLTETLCEGLNLSGEDDSDDETVDSHGLTEDDRDQILCLDPDL